MVTPRRELNALFTGNTGAATLSLHTPPEWTTQALCAEIGGDLWFPEKTGNGETGQSFMRQAKAICAECSVRAECLDYALNYESGDMGTATSYSVSRIYGGLTPNERKALLLQRLSPDREAS